LVGANITDASESPYAKFDRAAETPADEQTPYAQPRDGMTLVTSHKDGNIVAFAANGTVAYYSDEHDGYWDVDPSPRGDRTVVYAATDKVPPGDRCSPVDGGAYCVEQMIERANLTTGEVTTLYSRVDGRYHNSEWHDVDRVGPERFVVADMYADEVFIVNTTTGLVEWEWNAQSYASLTSGGEYPDNWVHLNDVEVVEDGRIMVSLRNQDQVVFIDKETGLVEENWTLGSDGNYDVMHAQHNPDYINESMGGPAVVVADSEQNRLLEYQRTASGEWERTWRWSDARLRWPRDADRLPNGNTLVSNTRGDQVFEIAPNGSVTWQINFPRPYETERLGTGDESTNGPSATRAGLASRGDDDTSASQSANSGLLTTFRNSVLGLVPSETVNLVAYFTPPWVGFTDIFLIVILGGTTVAWIGAELWWSSLRLRSPIERRD
jgi:hypothetical protein